MEDESEVKQSLLSNIAKTKSYDSIESSASSSRSDNDVPEDKYNFVYLMFFIQGVGLLLPWNIFITAHEYFTFKFIVDEKVKDTFENAFSVSAQLPNAAMLIVNLFLTGKVSRGLRILVGLVITGICFLTTDVFVYIDTKQWTDKFFVITILLVILINACAGILQGTIFGIAGAAGPRYIQGTMVGMGIGGIMVAIANMTSLAAGHSIQKSAFGYFTTAVIVIIGCFISYILLSRTKLMKYYFNQRPTENSHVAKQKTSASVIYILKNIYPQALSVCFVFSVTLALQPAIISNIVSVNKDNGSGWTNKYFTTLMCFLIFNCGDVAGRVIAGNVLIVRGNGIGLPLLCFLRIGFIPLFMFCNYQPREHLPVVFNHDFIPILLNFFFAVSNGYLASLCMMYGPQQVPREYMEKAGAIMQLFLSLGLCVGAGLSYAIIACI